MNNFVIGDIHGAYKALVQCLVRARFDYKKDRLICMGDVCDGWSQTKESIDELLKIKNLIYILGNHDSWTLEWAWNGAKDTDWLEQGGKATILSYSGKMTQEHIDFLIDAKPYYIKNNMLFVHAGFIPDVEIELQDKEIFLWDRSFAETVINLSRENPENKFTKYDEIYLGHTPTIRYKSEVPLKCGNVWFMDTGAGWWGKLTIMNIETKEFFQSDIVSSLYPDEKGRQQQ